jgi:hypothetical protein
VADVQVVLIPVDKVPAVKVATAHLERPLHLVADMAEQALAATLAALADQVVPQVAAAVLQPRAEVPHKVTRVQHYWDLEILVLQIHKLLHILDQAVVEQNPAVMALD